VSWIKRRVFISTVNEVGFERDFWVNDLIAHDADMFLRLRKLENCL
jgi:hypothetical protein